MNEIMRRGGLVACLAKETDIEHVALNLRDGDVRLALSIMPPYMTPADAVRHTVSASVWVAAVRKDDRCLGLIGVASNPLEDGVGSPWLLALDELLEHWATVARCTKPFVERMLKDFHLLRQRVDMRERRVLRWLEWVGFSATGPTPFGSVGLPFYTVEYRRPHEL